MARMKLALAWLTLATVSVACSSGSGPAPGALRASSPARMASSGSPTDIESRATPAAVTPPSPDAPIPRDPSTLAVTLVDTTEALHRSIDSWTGQGDPSKGTAPGDVVLRALYQQRIYRFLARNRALAERRAFLDRASDQPPEPVPYRPPQTSRRLAPLVPPS